MISRIPFPQTLSAAKSQRLGITVQTVRCWRRRWSGEPDLALADRLADAPRPGTPPTFTPEQICAILALACEPPEASGIPITHWSQSALAREAVKRGLVDPTARFFKRRLISSPIACAPG